MSQQVQDLCSWQNPWVNEGYKGCCSLWTESTGFQAMLLLSWIFPLACLNSSLSFQLNSRRSKTMAILRRSSAVSRSSKVSNDDQANALIDNLSSDFNTSAEDNITNITDNYFKSEGKVMPCVSSFPSKMANFLKNQFKSPRKRKISNTGSITLFPAYHMCSTVQLKVCFFPISYYYYHSLPFCLQIQTPSFLNYPISGVTYRKKQAKRKQTNQININTKLAHIAPADLVMSLTAWPSRPWPGYLTCTRPHPQLHPAVWPRHRCAAHPFFLLQPATELDRCAWPLHCIPGHACAANWWWWGPEGRGIEGEVESGGYCAVVGREVSGTRRSGKFFSCAIFQCICFIYWIQEIFFASGTTECIYLSDL